MVELHHATVFEAFRASAQRYAGHPFLHILPETAQIYDVPAGTLTYGDAVAEVERLAAIYRRAGYGHGHRAGLLLENRPAFFLHWLALNALGVSAVPINAEMRSAELEYLTGHSEICLAVTLAQRAGDLRAAASKAGRELVIATPETIAEVGAAPVAPSADRSARRGHRVRPALHLRHDRTSQGLRADKRVLPAGRRVVQPASAACAPCSRAPSG